jgi:hypothetical protein
LLHILLQGLWTNWEEKKQQMFNEELSCGPAENLHKSREQQSPVSSPVERILVEVSSKVSYNHSFLFVCLFFSVLGIEPKAHARQVCYHVPTLYTQTTEFLSMTAFKERMK